MEDTHVIDMASAEEMVEEEQGITKVTKSIGTLARDSLANERTYLAWLRTVMQMTAFGIVLYRTIDRMKIISIIIIITSIVFLILSTQRYFMVEKYLKKKLFQSAVVLILINAVVVSLILVILVIHVIN